MNETDLVLLKHYLETLLIEAARLDDREKSEDSASIKQLVVRCFQIAEKATSLKPSSR
jgi:hypothetical protein